MRRPYIHSLVAVGAENNPLLASRRSKMIVRRCYRSLTNMTGALLAALTVAGAARAQSPAPPAREIAVTFDDLPIASLALENDIPAQKAVTARLLDTLAAFHVPAIGFVNAGRF